MAYRQKHYRIGKDAGEKDPGSLIGIHILFAEIKNNVCVLRECYPNINFINYEC
ncbi:hypothetical protein SAMN05518672_1011245 [Chitinophaga sp. CF118]|nr:hypothetical protein SAMN05518672_1011245 [Chitinophaga sp. CF118]